MLKLFNSWGKDCERITKVNIKNNQAGRKLLLWKRYGQCVCRILKNAFHLDQTFTTPVHPKGAINLYNELRLLFALDYKICGK